LQIFFLTLTAIVLFSTTAGANVFVDWRGGFHVTYPDEWQVVPYSEVSSFLESQGMNVISLDYDAVLGEKGLSPFYDGAYSFLVLHETGRLSDRQIDSVLRTTAKEQLLEITEGMIGEGMGLSRGELVYDRNKQAMAIYSQIKTMTVEKEYLELRKFYEKGVALFLCYSPSERFGTTKKVFFGLLESFSTKDLEKVAPKQEVKIVDLSTREKLAAPAEEEKRPEPGSETKKESSSKNNIYLILLVVVIAAIALMVKLRKKITDSGKDR